jgi:hypothetical protein
MDHNHFMGIGFVVGFVLFWGIIYGTIIWWIL